VHALEIHFPIHIPVGVEAMKSHGERVGVPILEGGYAPGNIALRTDVARTVGEAFIRVHPQRIDVCIPMSVDLVGPDEMCHAE
jgi:hypothetical protein